MSGTNRGELLALLNLGSIGTLGDGALLDLFENRRDHPIAAERAFEALVQRHGGLVLRVARGRLASEEDARDTFQATFWLLARRSRSIRQRDALAGWLFGVASRIAARAAVEAARRTVRERHAAVPEVNASSPNPEPDLAASIEAEINRLPAKYRIAVLLRDLEGLSHEEAAHRLGCPVGTFKARLSRARARLRGRLTQRGIVPNGWEAVAPSCSILVPDSLLRASCQAVFATTAHGSSVAISASMNSLTPGASRTMIFPSISTWSSVSTLSLTGGLVALTTILCFQLSPTTRTNLSPAVVSSNSPHPVVAAVENNILLNGGFESGDKACLHWSRGAEVQGVKYLWDKASAQQGKASLCLDKSAQRYFPVAQWFQVVDRKTNESAIRVTAQVKADKVTKAIIDVIFLDEKGEWIRHEWAAYIGAQEPDAGPVTHEWKEYAGQVKIPTTARKIQLGLQIYGPGKVWFDQVRVEYDR